MIRLLLAVTVAAALLAVSLPAVEVARADRTATALDRTGDRLVRAGESLLATDEGDAGARRVVRVRLPARSLTRAGVREVRVDCDPTCAFRYRLRGGRRGERSLAGLPVATPNGPVVLSRPGTHRLRLGLNREAGRRVVTIRE